MPLEAEGALTMAKEQIQVLTPAGRALYKATQLVLSTIRPIGQPLPENAAGILAAAEKVYKQVDRSALPPDLSQALQYAIHALRSRQRGEVYRDLVQDAQSLLRPYTLEAPKKARREKTPTQQEPRVDRKLLEEYQQNFKEAQLSLDLRRPMNDRGWVQQKQPTKPMKIITGPDDRVFRLAIRDVDREDIEQRDADAIRDWADGYRPPCPITKYVVHDDGPGSFNVQGFVQNKEGDWKPVGRLFAYLSELDDGTKAFVSESADVPIPTLAACPGLGNGMYLAAANEACSRRSRLAGSGTRSVFSEHFWKKQIEKKRAYCSGDEASLYYSPSERLRNALLDGKITVPQYNAMRGRLPKYPDGGYWDCANVVLNDKWCKTPKKDRTLRGVGGRGRYRIVSWRG